MTVTGCASAVVTCRCIPARRRRGRQLLPAYGLQESPIQNQKCLRRSKPNTFPRPITPGGKIGSGHFYLAGNRTFLLCVDTGFINVKLAKLMVGPASRRHLTGFWPGRIGAKINEVPPMHGGGNSNSIATRASGSIVAETSDPENVSDPLGVPRNMLYMTRGIVFRSGLWKGE